jgi:hypothetical protein
LRGVSFFWSSAVAKCRLWKSVKDVSKEKLRNRKGSNEIKKLVDL